MRIQASLQKGYAKEGIVVSLSDYQVILGLFCSRFTLLFQLLSHHISLQGRQVIDKKTANKMVHFMLNTYRMKAFELFFETISIGILRLDSYVFSPFYIGVNSRN